MAWVQIAPGVYINQNIASSNSDAGAAARAAAERDAARRAQEAAQARAAAQAQALANARTAQANASAQRRELRNIRSADTVARRSADPWPEQCCINSASKYWNQSQEEETTHQGRLERGFIARSAGSGLNISA